MRRALVEGSIIVVSILLAFGIDAGWDRFQERQAERDAMRTLAAEFLTNLELARAGIRWTERHRANTVLLLQAARSPRLGASFQVPDSSVVYMVSITSLNASTGALDGVLGAQGLDLFQDPVLRSRIAAWPGYLRDVVEDQASASAFVQDKVIDVLSRHGDFSAAMEAAGSHFAGRASVEELSHSTEFTASAELLSVLGVHVGYLDRSAAALRGLEEATTEILALLPPA